MKRCILLAALFVVALAGCENKAAAPAEPAAAEAATDKPKHIDTNRAGFRAAGKAAKQIEKKGEDRNSAVDEAMKAGE